MFDHIKARSCVKWGTYGKNPAENNPEYKLTWVLIKDLANAHIDAILETEHQISDNLRSTFIIELLYREAKGIMIHDTVNYETEITGSGWTKRVPE